MLLILERGRIGETYLIGADGEQNNLEVVRTHPRALRPPADDYDLRHRPGRPRPALRDRLHQAARASWAGSRATPTSRPGWRAPSSGTRPTRPGGGRSKAGREAKYAAQGAVSRARRSRPTAIPGLLVVTLDVRGDNRGWFKENWQRAKMIDLGLPDFGPVQHNVSFNTRRGVTRGIHAEPWDKLVSVATGRIFGAWVDLREGAVVRHARSPTSSGRRPRSSCRAGSATPSRRSRTRRPTPTWSTTTGARRRRIYTIVNLADETVADRLADPARRPAVELSQADRDQPRSGRRDADGGRAGAGRRRLPASSGAALRGGAARAPSPSAGPSWTSPTRRRWPASTSPRTTW